MLDELSISQQNILVASIIGDGEITKIYPKSRRKNNSYREHYGEQQLEYRMWKSNKMNGHLYLTPKSNTLRSKSSTLYTKLYPIFYNTKGQKQIPLSLLPLCNLPEFLAVLLMDDGSLCITTRINHSKKLIYLTPHIYLYLQNFPFEELIELQHHINLTYGINLKIGKRKDGHGTILRTTSVSETFKYLSTIKDVIQTCPSMFYKTNWDVRLEKEIDNLKARYPSYQVLSSDPKRNREYTSIDINKLIHLKQQGKTDKEISQTMGRSYWSIVYKLSQLRKQGVL